VCVCVCVQMRMSVCVCVCKTSDYRILKLCFYFSSACPINWTKQNFGMYFKTQINLCHCFWLFYFPI